MRKKINKKKLVLLSLPIVTATLALASCNNKQPSSSSTSKPSTSSSSSSSTSSSVLPDVESVVITGSGENIVSRKQSLQLTATVVGSTEDKSVTWTSSSDKVLVSADGLVEVKDVQFADSVAVITATSNADSSKKAELSITIKASEIVIGKTDTSVEIKDREVADFDFKTLFSLTVDGDSFSVTDDMLDYSDVQEKEGYYTVLCSYGGQNAFLTIHVSKTVYAVTSSVENVTLKVKEVADYNFKDLFVVSIDGEKTDISDEMVTSDVKAEVGTYSYTVTLGDTSKTIVVEVIEDHVIDVVNSYKTKTITLSEVENFDATELFSLTVDGVAKKVTANMIDVSSLKAEEGKYLVTLTYKEDSTVVTSSVEVVVVADHELALSGKNVTIYPNSERLDVTSLFSLKIDGVEHNELISLLDITGSIDYSRLGENTLTLNYGGKTATAVVTIATGAHLEVTKSDVIIIKKGTSMDEYSFNNDVILISNGQRFVVANRYIDTSKVDFSAAGSYEVVVKVPYTQGSTTEDVTLVLTYVVRQNIFDIRINQEVIDGTKDLSDNDILSAITVTVNNIKQSLYTDKDQVTNNLTTYVEIDKSKVDFSKSGIYPVTLKVYIDGKDSENPTEVLLSINVVSNVALSVDNSAKNYVFEGDVFDPTTLFTIKEGEESVFVTRDMIEGKVDVFTPGCYTLKLIYKGEQIEKNVFVVSKDFLGTYKTNMRGTTTTDTSGDDEDEATSTTTTINRTFVFDGNASDDVTSISAVDENTLLIRYLSNDFYFTQENGIAVLLPVNRLNMKFNENNRQYIFAKTDVYTLLGKLTFNTSSEYVVDNSSPCTSIDVLVLRNAAGEKVYYGLVTELAEHTSADFYYRHSFGKVTFSEDFDLSVGSKGTVKVNDYSMYVVMNDAVTGKRTDKETTTKKYTGTYQGTVDNKQASLEITASNGVSLYVDGKEVADLSISNINSLKFGGYDYVNDKLFIYDTNNYEFAYKINLNTADNTFTVDEKDGYQGLFVKDNLKVFLDGYGTGIVKASSSYADAVNINYVYKSGLIEVTYVNVRPSFKYGSRMSLFMDSYKNSVVIADSDYLPYVKMELESQYVSQGAKVSISDYEINMLPVKEDAIDELISKFTITTAEGTVKNVDDYLDYSLVDFTKAGFYLVSLTMDINGNPVVKYYTFEVLAPLYENNPVVGEYINASSSSYTLSIDKFGTATFKYSSSSYTGKVNINADYTFETVLTKVGGTATVTVSGSMTVEGALVIKLSGDKSHDQRLYLDQNAVTTGNSRTTIIKSFTRNGVTTYIYCTSETDLGEIAEVKFLNDKTTLEKGAILEVTSANHHAIVRVENLGNNYSGLTLAGDERGSYSNGNDSLTLDGFGLTSSTRGVATLGSTSYVYYVSTTGSNLIVLCNSGTSTVSGYVVIDKEANTYTSLEKKFESLAYGKVSYSSVDTSTTSDHYLSIDEYGVGTYYYGSTKYVGNITSVDALGNMVFEGRYVSYSIKKTITVTLTKLGDYIYQTSVVTVSGTSTSSPVTSYIIPTSAKRESYLGYENANYLTHYVLNDKDIFLFFKTSSASPLACKVTLLNDLLYTEKGALIKVTNLDESEVYISKAMITKSTSNTRIGYLPASALAGTYTCGDTTFTIDGFASIKANTTGVITMNDVVGTYEMITEKVIRATVGENTYVYTLESNNVATAVSDTSYQGTLLGTFSWLSSSSAVHAFTVDKYGIIKCEIGSTTYIGMLPSGYSEGELTVTLTEVGSAYGSTKKLVVDILSDDILTINEGSSSYFYIKEGTTGKLYANVSSSSTIIYEVTKGSDKFYLYAPSDGKVTSAISTLVKQSDSKVELGEVGAIFAINYGNESLVFKLASAGKLVVANMDERKTLTNSEGKTLFVDGFTTSETSRGNATLDGESYTYYFNPFYENVITLYEGNDPTYYVSVNGDKYELIGATIDQEKFAAGTYYSANSTSTTNVIVINEYGFGKLNGATGRFVVDPDDATGSTLIFTGKTNVNYSFKTTKITIVADGVYALSGENKGYYYNGTEAVMAGKSWKDLVFKITTYKGEVVYVLSKSNSYNPTDLIGVVTVTGDFNVVGGIFTVKVGEGQTLSDGKATSFTAKFNRSHGYDGYVLGDGYDGTYTNGSSSIILNGFGGANVNGKEGTYVISGTTLTITIDSTEYVYTIDKENKTYEDEEIEEGDVLAGKTYVGEYNAVDWDTYDELPATVTLAFDGKGNVKMTFVCPTYEGNYHPEYLGTGTYVIDSNEITIKSGTATIVLSMNSDGTLSCSEATYEDEYAFGNFARGEVDFELQ